MARGPSSINGFVEFCDYLETGKIPDKRQRYPCHHICKVHPPSWEAIEEYLRNNQHFKEGQCLKETRELLQQINLQLKEARPASES